MAIKVAFSLVVPSLANPTELYLLLAEAFAIDRYSDAFTLSRRQFIQNGHVHLEDDYAKSNSSLPFNYASRIAELVTTVEVYSPSMQTYVQSLNSTCINLTTIETSYGRSQDTSVASVQSAIVGSVLSSRSAECGYPKADIKAFVLSELSKDIEAYERYIGEVRGEDPTYGLCYLDRISKAAARLQDDNEPINRGFLTQDTCILQEPSKAESSVDGDSTTQFLPGDMVDIVYPSIAMYQPDATSVAWLVNPPSTVKYGSVWFSYLNGVAVDGMINLFTLPGPLTLSLHVTGSHSFLTVYAGCFSGIRAASSPPFQIRPDGWNFASMSLADGFATVRLNNHVWRMKIPKAPVEGCADRKVTLGPRLSLPVELYQAEDVTVRFHGFKVSSNPAENFQVDATAQELTALGFELPVRCLTDDGFEERVDLTHCVPSKILRTLRTTAKPSPIEKDKSNVKPSPTSLPRGDQLASDDNLLSLLTARILIYSLLGLLIVSLAYLVIVRFRRYRLAESIDATEEIATVSPQELV